MTFKKIIQPLGFIALLLIWAGLVCLQTGELNAGDQKKDKAQTKTKIEKHMEVEFTVSCKECHAEETPEIVEDWEAGMHGQVNVGCFVCHGDGEVEFYAKPGVARCEGCHSAYDVDFKSVPGISSCFTCHQGHTLKFHKHEGKVGFGSLE